jgi:hypothetical protein
MIIMIMSGWRITTKSAKHIAAAALVKARKLSERRLPLAEEHAIDKDQVYGDLAKQFTDEEIIELGLFCAEFDGVGKFVKSLNVLSGEEACELNPNLKSGTVQVVVE